MEITKVINIAYLATGKNKGGVESALLEFLRHIDKDKFRLLVLSTDNPEFIEELDELGIGNETFSLPVSIMKIRRWDVSWNPLFLLKNIIKILPAVYGIRKILKNKKIEILHTNGLKAHLIGVLCCLLTKCKLIWHMHDLLPNRKVKLLYSFLAWIFVDKIIAVSNAVQLLFEKDPDEPENTVLIHNGIDTDAIETENINNSKRILNKTVDNEVIIGCVGYLTEMKGQKFLVSAIPMVLKYFENIKVVITGSSYDFDIKYKEELLEMVKDLNLNDYIMFIENNVSIGKLISEFDILVHPTLLESFGMVLIEAGARGIPVIASKTGGCIDIIEDDITGILVPTRDSLTMAEAIINLISDHDKRKKMGSNAQKRIKENFNIKKQVKKLEEVYLNLL